MKDYRTWNGFLFNNSDDKERSEYLKWLVLNERVKLVNYKFYLNNKEIVSFILNNFDYKNSSDMLIIRKLLNNSIFKDILIKLADSEIFEIFSFLILDYNFLFYYSQRDEERIDLDFLKRNIQKGRIDKLIFMKYFPQYVHLFLDDKNEFVRNKANELLNINDLIFEL